MWFSSRFRFVWEVFPRSLRPCKKRISSPPSRRLLPARAVRFTLGLRFNFFTVNGNEIHFVHAVSGRHGVNGVGFGHANLGTARGASIAHVDSAEFAIRWRCGNRTSQATDHHHAKFKNGPTGKKCNRNFDQPNHGFIVPPTRQIQVLPTSVTGDGSAMRLNSRPRVRLLVHLGPDFLDQLSCLLP